MAYEKLNWQNGKPPALNAENLNHMDDGIANADTAASQALEAAQTAGMKVIQIYKMQSNSENVQEVDLGEHFNTAKMLIVGFRHGTFGQDVDIVMPGLFNQVQRTQRNAAIMVDSEQTGQAYEVYHVGVVSLNITGTKIKIAAAVDCISKTNIPNFKFAYLFAVE